jgi:hypothetical protein
MEQTSFIWLNFSLSVIMKSRRSGPYVSYLSYCSNTLVKIKDMVIYGYEGSAIAQAVSRWLPTAAARIRSRVWSSGICGGQSGAGAGFLRVLRFPLPIFIPPIAPQSPSPIIWGWYNRLEVAAVQGLSPIPLALKKIRI